MYISMYICSMARRFSIAEARSNLPSIVNQAAAGSPIELTRRGRAVAVLVSLREFERLRGDRSRFGDAYKSFLEKYSLRDVGVERGFFESIRSEDGGREVSL
jgi:prevent-host-death family protein